MSVQVNSLIQKYNVPGPRYTSYPTVPYWEEQNFSLEQWKQTLKKSFDESNQSEGISLYIHLPFCESLCTFCGCHKRVTKKHEMEQPYIQAVLKEWDLYCELLQEKPIIKEIHLGGGTPTFFSMAHLAQLIQGILAKADVAPVHEFSFEGHPNNTMREHLQGLYDLGFRRVSYGVQDYNETVQKAIHRIQPYENVKQVTEWAREIGYESISHDLVFGLPFQSLEDVLNTIEQTNSLLPDRLALYSYAHVPWIKGNGQRGFKDADVPKDAIKRECYEEGKKKLLAHGYHEIGMDHFALEKDAMYQSFQAGTLHRNFMGYTASKTQVMIGLGISSISDSWYSFAQNVKTIEEYYECLARNEIPVFKGHVLNQEDLIIRQHILNLMCSFSTSWGNPELRFPEIDEVLEQLEEMEQDGLIQFSDSSVTILEKGKPFVRNICMAFDLRLKQRVPENRIFSMTI
ncbi:oxygen-independent coproporphyrinogen III oxidase [Acinetobacter lwoffii]|jgi:oxygen-independent coproporphyrinogen III oxidase|uniref:Coproporphyrinogen-III oxidase n=1 Tax=Acinetobacter lwoffii TaxID=28090 RepID=A0AAJ3AHL0_ACILW|nr:MULTISPECIES: oxygen-independent coproporphyrinogen III oxidase [Pseudomonadota]ENU61662.1 oxygen-independent coproporphyrinogen III oxidase [Acinetobacter lwoffii NIPH 715]ENX32817.1 oxygen-independent coproporphyrinogen III oxidase [Acinetobacter sp. CIP 64.7]MCU4422160.1 oxygen-independent coproporphyrinogen III oxidase [Acinetobacter lwoffii]MCU4450172.1 oxygen-independent coproporphyrinogen III oxidase [Acinetobacter lwoffii]MCU4615811.1 oxygen-independent coproporphyrinogen III oxidas